MQEFEKKENPIKLTVDLGSRPKKSPLAPQADLSQKKNTREFINQFMESQFKTTNTIKGSEYNWNGEKPAVAQSSVKSKLGVTLVQRSRPDLEARKVSPDRYIPVQAKKQSSVVKWIKMTFAVILISAVGVVAKLGYDRAIGLQKEQEIEEIQAKIRESSLKYYHGDPVTRDFFTKMRCDKIAVDLRKIQNDCDSSGCTDRVNKKLKEAVDSFKDLCGEISR